MAQSTDFALQLKKRLRLPLLGESEARGAPAVAAGLDLAHNAVATSVPAGTADQNAHDENANATDD